MKKIIPLVLFIAIVSGVYVVLRAEKPVERTDMDQTVEVIEDTSEKEENEPSSFLQTYSIDEPDSLWIVVNKQRPISLDYTPENLRVVDVTARTDKSKSELSMRNDAAIALETLFERAGTEDIELLLGSGYRDADLQSFYYTNYVNSYGQAEADKFSAKPGTSEHQTGLVADVAPANDTSCYLDVCFADTDEGAWLAANAHKFGFIIRYPKGKEAITGYQFEPWHIRFVGEELASILYEQDLTMEEYFELI